MEHTDINDNVDCNDNVENLTERWLSLLKHICNTHEFDGNHYIKCSHGPLTSEDDEPKIWLQPENAPFQLIEKIVNDPTLLSDLKHLVHNCHTGNLENFHSLALKGSILASMEWKCVQN